MKAYIPLSAAALATVMFAMPPAVAGTHEVTLANPVEALSMCKSGKIGEWVIAAIIGPPGFSQYGPGYGCKQAVETVSGIGDAVETGKGVCHLATPAAAKAICHKMGSWDIAIVQGKPGYSQFGPSYQCKQEIPVGTGVGNAVCE